MIDWQLCVLEHNYPAWRVNRHASGMWSAIRIALQPAGFAEYVIQPTLEGLAASLAEQLEPAHLLRGRRLTARAGLLAG